jgi:hypothetical protein
LSAISAGPPPAETEFSVDELPLAAIEKADGLHLPATLTGHFSGSTSTMVLMKKRFGRTPPFS